MIKIFDMVNIKPYYIPYSVNIKDTKKIFSQNVLYNM